MISWPKLLDQAGITQRELAALVEYGEGTISDLVNKDVGGPKLKKLVRRVLEQRISASQSEVDPASPSETSGLELREKADEYRTVEEWKQIAISAQQEVARLRAAVHALTPLNSTPSLSEAQSIAKQSGDEHDRRPKK